MRGITGVTGAAPIFREIMLKLHDRYGTSWYQMPEGVRRCWIDPLTGHRVSPEQPGAVEEIYAFPPQTARADDYDAAGGFVYQRNIELGSKAIRILWVTCSKGACRQNILGSWNPPPAVFII